MRFGGIAFADAAEHGRKGVDVDGLVLQEDVLVLVDGDDHALVGELFDGACLRGGHFDAGLKDGAR